MRLRAGFPEIGPAMTRKSTFREAQQLYLVASHSFALDWVSGELATFFSREREAMTVNKDDLDAFIALFTEGEAIPLPEELRDSTEGVASGNVIRNTTISEVTPYDFHTHFQYQDAGMLGHQ